MGPAWPERSNRGVTGRPRAPGGIEKTVAADPAAQSFPLRDRERARG